MNVTQNASEDKNEQSIPNVDELEEILGQLQEKTINYKNYVSQDEVHKIKCKLLISSINVRNETGDFTYSDLIAKKDGQILIRTENINSLGTY